MPWRHRVTLTSNVASTSKWLRSRGYTDLTIAPLRNALTESQKSLLGIGQLVARTDVSLPMPKPFGLHASKTSDVHELLRSCVKEPRSELLQPEDSIAAHCSYAVAHEFPWFPFMTMLGHCPEAKEAVAAAILQALPEGSKLGRRWWFAYELFYERLAHPDCIGLEPVPFLPPERFFCTTGRLSERHRVIDNLLGSKDFCPFVEKFAGADEAVEQFRGELMDVLSPICMMTVKDFLTEAGLRHGIPVDDEKFQRLLQQLHSGGFQLTSAEREELRWQLGQEALTASRLVTFASWLRGDSPLAFRLREHLLGVEPIDLQWHAPGEVFLDRLSRVISSVETRASQLLEGDLPPNKKERFFVDAISKPWTRNDVVVNIDLIKRLQQGLLSVERYDEVLKTQVVGEPRRTTQNWISSEKHDPEYGKELVLHYLPPPPEMLPKLYEGYFHCVQRMLEDPAMDPIVCATIAKIALNTLHPMADGNGRVQRMIFQLVLFRFNFLPRVNIPVSVVMLQDRTGYEVMQQGHVEQMMAGLRHELVRLEGETEDSFQHRGVNDTLGAVYRYQDFTFAVSCMTKLMQNTLPVLAAKAYFLRRFDWRVDELLKDDALLPPRAATKIAKTFKNDASRGLSYFKVLKLIFMDGWWIGMRRILHFLQTASHPEDLFGLRRFQKRLVDLLERSNRRRWLMSSGQQAQQDKILAQAERAKAEGNYTGCMRWVAISLEKFETSDTALRWALNRSRPGDTVIAVHYPNMVTDLVPDGLFPEFSGDLLSQITTSRQRMLDKVQNIAEHHRKESVEFQVLVGDAGSDSYKPARALCRDLQVAEIRPFRIYVGYDRNQHYHKFTDYIVQHAPCDVGIIKVDSNGPVTRWVGISSRNLKASAAALTRAFHDAHAGDLVVAIHYPVNPFLEIGGSVYEAHFSSVCDDNLDVIMDSALTRVIESSERVAQNHCKEGVRFHVFTGAETPEPHKQLVGDAITGVGNADILPPNTIYVGYNERRDRTKLVDPHKQYDVAEYIVRNSPCNVVVVKDTNNASNPESDLIDSSV